MNNDQLLPAYQVNFDGRLRLERLRELAMDRRPARSPIVGIPILQADGTRICIKVKRSLLAAGCEMAESAHWDVSANRLVLNGGKRSCWRLIPIIQDCALLLWIWAEAQRKRSVSAKSATPGQRKAAKIDLEIGVLQRKRDKMHARRPINPICEAPREYLNGDDYHRESELRWTQGKRIRKALAKQFTVPALQAIRRLHYGRPDWKGLYKAAARILPCGSIGEGNRHSRVCKRTNGPTLDSYVRHPERHLARMEKPYTRGIASRWDSRNEVEIGDGVTKPETHVETMRRLRMEYLEQLSAMRAIDGEIENLRVFKAAVLDETEVTK